jgi:hypothetical protein
LRVWAILTREASKFLLDILNRIVLQTQYRPQNTFRVLDVERLATSRRLVEGQVKNAPVYEAGVSECLGRVEELAPEYQELVLGGGYRGGRALGRDVAGGVGEGVGASLELAWGWGRWRIV